MNTHSANEAIDRTGWPDPRPLSALEPAKTAASFPSVFPGWFGQMAEAAAAASQTPVELAYNMMLPVLSSAAGLVSVRAGNDHKEPLNLYVIAPMPKGNRKSSLLGLLAGPLNQLDLMFADTEADARSDDWEVPFLMSDVAVSSLVEVLAEGTGAASIIAAESSVLDMLRRSGAAANVDVLLSAWSAEPIRYRRRDHKGGLVIRRPALTIGLCPQPSVVEDLLANRRLYERGFIDRCLLAEPPSNIGSRDMRAPSVPADVVSGYHDAVCDLFIACHNRPGTELVLSDQASEAWLSFLEQIEPQRAPDGRLGGEVQGFASKLDGTVLRLAGLLHLAAHGKGALDRQVDADTVADAVAVAEYYIAEAVAVRARHGMARGGLLERVAHWIIRETSGQFSQRDLQRRFSVQVHDVEPILDDLTKAGWVRPLPAPRAPGRPAKLWQVNPTLHPAARAA